MRDISSQIFHNGCACVKYIHSGIAGDLSAYEVKEGCEILLSVSRNLAILECEIHFTDEYLNDSGITLEGKWTGIKGELDEFIFDCSSLSTKSSLLFFYIKIKNAYETLYVKRFNNVYITHNSSIEDLFQLSFSKFEYAMPRRILGGVIYHVFVDRFNRGGETPVSKGAVLVEGEWENIPEYPEYPGAPLKNNTFFGGTLYGIIEKLDYIKSLGTTVIYLSPIFSSVSNHKYDTADYMTVDEMFGGDEALKLLIKEADKRGISIILDGVFNHTGDDSVYFNKYSRFDKVGAYNSKNSPYYSWFDFKDYPDKYTCWWDIPILPRINPDISECGNFIAGEDGVVEKYRKMGVYGFRLDVADELSDKFISDIKSRLSIDGESILYGEVWEDASNKISYGVRKKYYLGNELDGVMNYPLRDGIIDYIVKGELERLAYALTDVFNNMPKRIRDQQMNLLGSHDTVRILTALCGESVEGLCNSQLRVKRLSKEQYDLARARLISAYTILSTLPGLPAVFYGDEAGLEGYGDPFCRMPYPWGREDSLILERYKKMGELRLKNKIYRQGDYKLLYLSSSFLAFARFDHKNVYITVFNNSSSKVELRACDTVTDVLTKKKVKSIVLEKYGSTVIKSDKDLVFEIVSEGM